ncbi:lisH domain-containing protein C1711.05-like isoform X2 [Acropora millepora]|nr:lisH domain-containing protein C1711.05-like isoform X2 [Acropora millepora]
MSHNTKSSKYVFQNGQYLGDYYKKSKFFLSESVKGRSIYHTLEELTVSVQGHYQVSTYKLTMTEKHYNSNLKSIFDSLTYRVFRNVEPSPLKARVEEIRANLRSRHREHDTSDDTDSSITDSESISEDDKTELSSSDSEIEANSTQAELSDESLREFDGFSSLFNEQEDSDLVEDDASDSDDDQESSGYDSNSGDNNIVFRLSDSESADENTKPAATIPAMSDPSVHELLDGLSSLFHEHEESDLDDDDCMGDDSLCLLDGVSTLFEEHNEYGDLADDEESTVATLGRESTHEDKQSTPKAGHWETAIKSFKIAAGVAGVGLALYAAYKYFR